MASSRPLSMEKLMVQELVSSGATMTKKQERTTSELSIGLTAGAEGLVRLARMALAPPSAQARARADMPNVPATRVSHARIPTGPSSASTAFCAASKGKLRSSKVNEPIIMSGKTMNSPRRMARKNGLPLKLSSRHKRDWASCLLFICRVSLASPPSTAQCIQSG